MGLPRKALFAVQIVSLGALIALAGASPPLYADTADESGRSTGVVVDDSVITTKVKSALIADDDVKAFDISVKTREGNVMLSGFVDDASQAQRAVEIARNVGGVKDVSNQITVKK
jgi:hyperosmotically inducible protein